MNNFEKLTEVYNEIDNLIANRVNSSSPAFAAWKTKTERLLIRIYGENSFEHQRLKKTSFSLSICTFDTPDSAWIKACKEGLEETKAILSTYLDEIKDDSQIEENNIIVNKNYTKVFVVHGHDGELREAVCRLVERQGIEPIVLNQQANQGKTIIEKFEGNSDVQSAICLFTADDDGKSKTEEELKKRARQNVVFESGYFIGKLGRENVVFIADKDIEIPSDMSGIVYSNRDEWRFNLLKELKAIGFQIDYNKLE